ncbi:MarR family winged helix-turn-helix transcriptional regulator [Mycolicibacterium baixiangningiae]|uniref:MarR family winged helix-turn-helix transcriptional regulator n=1 Tax=Mycolicibacterium baixiangningiae TaxID=2761578 RepID=UPI001E4DED6F|nr:MarR family transcriptional regulator [Mycolicibacterium baixiangningiae]
MDPLSADEEAFWRALLQVVIALPRAIDDDFRGTGLTMSSYGVLSNLSEADGWSLRLSQLAVAGWLSPSRISRLVDSLQAEGLVTKRRAEGDGRAHVATLTEKGFGVLEQNYSISLASARHRVLDHLGGQDAASLAALFTRIAGGLE